MVRLNISVSTKIVSGTLYRRKIEVAQREKMVEKLIFVQERSLVARCQEAR